jgi:hypothetical protein
MTGVGPVQMVGLDVGQILAVSLEHEHLLPHALAPSEGVRYSVRRQVLWAEPSEESLPRPLLVRLWPPNRSIDERSRRKCCRSSALPTDMSEQGEGGMRLPTQTLLASVGWEPLPLRPSCISKTRLCTGPNGLHDRRMTIKAQSSESNASYMQPCNV